MFAMYTKKNHAQYGVCDSGVYSREIINMLLVCQVSGLVENFNIGIFSDILDTLGLTCDDLVLFSRSQVC